MIIGHMLTPVGWQLIQLFHVAVRNIGPLWDELIAFMGIETYTVHVQILKCISKLNSWSSRGAMILQRLIGNSAIELLVLYDF